MSQRRQSAPAWDGADPDVGWQSIDWNRHSRDIKVNGRRVHYVELGSGPAVVLIHGQGGCWQWWLRTIPALAAEARVIAIDLAGFGDSEPIAGRDVINQQVATILGVLDYLQLPSAVIVGHSMGGLVSLELARQAAHRMRALVIVDSAADAIGSVRLRVIVVALRLFNIVFSAQSGRPAFVARRPRLRAGVLFAAMKYPAAMSKSRAFQLLPRMAAPGFMNTLLAAAGLAETAGSPRVSCPTLIVWGDSDRILPLHIGQALADQVPGAELAVLRNVGHSPMLEVPGVFNDLLAEFIRKPMWREDIGRATGGY